MNGEPWNADGGVVWVEGIEEVMEAGCCEMPLPSGECCGQPIGVPVQIQVQQQIGSFESPEQAALACTAVNAHEALVKALEQINRHLEDSGIDAEEADGGTLPVYWTIRKEMLAALALARGDAAADERAERGEELAAYLEAKGETT